MKNIEKVWDYFFSLDHKLSKKEFMRHYFLDLIFFIGLLFLSFIVVSYTVPTDLGDESLNILEASITTFIFYFDTLICCLLLYLNRISIVLRRLNYLKLSRIYLLLSMLPFVGMAFDLFLMVAPLEKVVKKIEEFEREQMIAQKNSYALAMS